MTLHKPWLAALLLLAGFWPLASPVSAQQRARLEFREREPAEVLLEFRERDEVEFLPVVQEVPALPPVTGDTLPSYGTIMGEAAAPAAPPPVEPQSFWQKNPPYRVYPRVGNFPVPPTGPGYYSFRDFLTGTHRDKPPPFPYPPFAMMPPSFFDADFRYLADPKNADEPFARLHHNPIGDNWLFSTGGQAWWRYMNEVNSRLSGLNNSYDLVRARVFGDLWYRDSFRLYAEFITAHSFNQDLPPLLIDQNRADLLNAFFDLKIAEFDERPVYVRFGRQEMLLGSQRLISTLDWANTRRNFDGVRLFRPGEKFDVDLFWLMPVIPDAGRFDSHDRNQNFAGAWTTYRPEKGVFMDAYYLFLDNANRLTRAGIDFAPFNVHTFGLRYAGAKNNFLWDVENAIQFGERGDRSILAGMSTVGGGYHFKDRPLNPTAWIYYDYASGDRNPNQGTYNTFNQLFAFGHYYLGWADLVGRQNIHDLNFHLWLYPTNWITFNTQYHIFWLDSSRDALYSAGGIPLRRSPLGTAGNFVGSELDLIFNFHLGPRTDILTGYSRLFAGDFIRNTGPGRSPELFYFMYNVRW